MAALVAKTRLVFTSGFYLGWGTKAQKDGIASRSLASRTGFYQVLPLHKAGPRVGVHKSLEVSNVFKNLSKILHPLPETLYFADSIRGLQNPHPTLSFSWGFSLKELLSWCGGLTRECPQKAHNRNLGEASWRLIKTFREKPKFLGGLSAPPPALSIGGSQSWGVGVGVFKGRWYKKLQQINTANLWASS